MFDYVKYEVPLKFGKEDLSDFQTKDLYNHMERYMITKEGKLICEWQERFNCGPTEIPYNGELHFHAFLDDTRMFVVFRAVFKEGQLASLALDEKKTQYIPRGGNHDHS